jgi:hypothetical protein
MQHEQTYRTTTITTPIATDLAMTSYNSLEYEKKLVAYTITYMETGDDARAQAASGLGSTAHSVVIARLKRNGSLAALHPSGRPVKYHEGVCARAFDILIENPGELHTLKGLLRTLEEEGTVEAPGNRDTFSTHLHEWAAAHGYHMYTNSNKSIFYLTDDDKSLRVQFSRSAMELLGDKPPEHLICVDETTIQECPPPKGECTHEVYDRVLQCTPEDYCTACTGSRSPAHAPGFQPKSLKGCCITHHSMHAASHCAHAVTPFSPLVQGAPRCPLTSMSPPR